MNDINPPLPMGYSPIPAGKTVNVVTCLEMLARPPARQSPVWDTTLAVERWHAPDLAAYRSLYRSIGEDWMWVSRLEMTDDDLQIVLGNPKVEVYVLTDGPHRLGLVELDFRKDGEAELAFFGLVKTAIGNGAGRLMMNHAIATAWAHPIRRFWVHTCHFDHPAALPFYQRSGFKPYAFMVEVSDDPRLTGVLPRTAAPHVPLIDV